MKLIEKCNRPYERTLYRLTLKQRGLGWHHLYGRFIPILLLRACRSQFKYLLWKWKNR